MRQQVRIFKIKAIFFDITPVFQIPLQYLGHHAHQRYQDPWSTMFSIDLPRVLNLQCVDIVIISLLFSVVSHTEIQNDEHDEVFYCGIFMIFSPEDFTLLVSVLLNCL